MSFAGMVLFAWGELAAHAEIDPEDRVPRGMMLSVEGKLAPTIGRRRDRRRALLGTAPLMHDLDGRGIEDMSSQTTQGGAKVDVLAVKEKPLVQQSRRLRLGPPDEETGATDPVDAPLGPSTVLDQLCK